MTTNAKKLPCNHIFHISCLRSWFQRQQTCPTCRLDVLQPQQPRQAAVPAPHPGHYSVKILSRTLEVHVFNKHAIRCVADRVRCV